MNTTTAIDALVIDGAKLRQAREMRGLTVAELAALCTLSREQVQHIEDGGDRPFYTPAHKLLAIRKYAAAMGIPYDDIVTGPGADDTMPGPDDAPASLMVHGEGEEATDLRLAAVERNAEIRRRILIGAVTATIVLAIYAKMHGNPTTTVRPATETASAETTTTESAATETAATDTRAAVQAQAPAATTPAPAQSAAIAAATPAAAAPSPASKPADPGLKSTNATAATTTPASAASPAPAAPTADKLAGSDEPCARPPSADVKTWTPSYQRKADTRLFLVSPKETTVCVHDASGKAALLTLKARTGQAYSGKPPYVVQSPQLSDIEIYLQGMRARVPAQAPALRLQVSPSSTPDAG